MAVPTFEITMGFPFKAGELYRITVKHEHKHKNFFIIQRESFKDPACREIFRKKISKKASHQNEKNGVLEKNRRGICFKGTSRARLS